MSYCMPIDCDNTLLPSLRLDDIRANLPHI